MLVNSNQFIHVRDSSYIITTIMKNVVPMSEKRGWSINLIDCHSYIVFTAYRGPQHKNVKTFAVLVYGHVFIISSYSGAKIKSPILYDFSLIESL